jgi:hypothetical protein
MNDSGFIEGSGIVSRAQRSRIGLFLVEAMVRNMIVDPARFVLQFVAVSFFIAGSYPRASSQPSTVCGNRAQSDLPRTLR